MLVAKDTLVDSAVTDEKGIAEFRKDVPLGNYYVKEIQAPAGYVSSLEIQRVSACYESENGGQNIAVQQYLLKYENERNSEEPPVEEPKPIKPSKPKKEEPKDNGTPEFYPVPETLQSGIVNTGDLGTPVMFVCVALLAIAVFLTVKIWGKHWKNR